MSACVCVCVRNDAETAENEFSFLSFLSSASFPLLRDDHAILNHSLSRFSGRRSAKAKARHRNEYRFRPRGRETRKERWWRKWMFKEGGTGINVSLSLFRLARYTVDRAKTDTFSFSQLLIQHSLLLFESLHALINLILAVNLTLDIHTQLCKEKVTDFTKGAIIMCKF